MSESMDDLLVACTTGLYLIEGGHPRRILPENCYGLSWNDTDLFYGSRHDGGGVKVWRGSDPKRNEMLYPGPVHDIHQILWWDGKLYVTNTRHNRLDVWDNGDLSYIEWLDKDLHGHINSVWCDGSQFYVCEHRMEKTPAHIRIFDLNFKELGHVRLFKQGIHNVYVDGEVLYTLSTYKFLRKRYDKIEVLREEPSYLRGLARTKNGFYIGISEVRARENRHAGNGEVIMIDNRFKFKMSIPLTGAGQIHEVRALSGDLAHNNLVCPVDFS